MSSGSPVRTVASAVPRKLRTLVRNPRGAARKVRSSVPDAKTSKARAKSERRNLYATLPIREQVLYESYYGVGALCNPHAIFLELLDDPRFSHLKHVWVLKDDNVAPTFLAQYREHPRVRVVRFNSAAYERALYTSRYLINNSTFPPHFAKREEQVYLNTWHGTPLKKMGYHIAGDRFNTTNIVRNFLMADYLVSPNEHTTQTMYLEGYRLDGIFQGAILETGYPRNDESLKFAHDRDGARDWLAEYGLGIPAGTTTVLFAPTWKGASYYRPANDAEDVAEMVLELQDLLGDDYHVLVKVHQQVMHHAQALPELRDRLVPGEVPTNGALAAADVLVSDYSSIFFDYLALDRPIFFYTPEQEDYEATRGTYLRPDELPGPTLVDVPALAEAIRGAKRQPGGSVELADAARAAAIARFAGYEDGNAAKRVVDVVFGGAEDLEVGRVVRADLSKQRVLIYLGGMKRNGITSSALNLLGNLDYERFDVSVNFATPESAASREMIALVDERARLLQTFYEPAGQLGRTSVRGLADRKLPLGKDLTRDQLSKAFHREWRRIFGDSRFDYAVDFSGYAPLPAALLLASPPAMRSIWLHNDVAADRRRSVNGKRPHWANLGQVAELYPHFDRLVSVSESLSEVNQASFGDSVAERAFAFAHNTIDGSRVRELATASDAVERELSDPSAAPRELRARELALHPMDKSKVFVTAGRVSTEKNHRRLVDAFAQVAAEDPDARLVIVGDGPLRSEVASHVRSLRLSRQVLLVGQTANPFVYMAHAGCFVLSSDYEGQPMVILEARVLGLPVISTAFASVRSALPEGAGTIVARDADGLAAGLREHLAGEVPASALDADSYNAECMAEFYSAIGAS